ncbi:hypothetical protein [Hansschlegelia sp.]|uniref:hypothetical protein n=1 Tax=Hansschlegelia sp. TaxID=2041892 RepID=UPI002CA3A772|nr:hypothetical protein [Hansschlegelia sp.]HVI30448.1 hypothetical protein [Hansschlegelia sp.]
MPNTEQSHDEWARRIVRLAHTEALKRGVPDKTLAQALLVQAIMLLTGRTEQHVKARVHSLGLLELEPKIARRIYLEGEN